MFAESAITPGRRSPALGSLGCSLAAHFLVLLWVAWGEPPSTAAPETKPKSLYEIAIAGREKKLVWYRLSDRLPRISPLERRGISQPAHARVLNRQQIVSQGPRRSPQLIWQPAPRIQIERELPSPNLLALSAPRAPAPPPAPKLFAPPPERRPAVAPAPDSPTAPPPIAESSVRLPDAPKLPARSFTPPRRQEAGRPPVTIEDAPRIAASATLQAAQAPKLPARRFVPPSGRAAPRQAFAAEAAPGIVNSAGLRLPAAPRLPAREFVPPPARSGNGGGAAFDAAPSLQASGSVSLPTAPRLPARTFNAPSPAHSESSSPDFGGGPGADFAPSVRDIEIAVVGLNPATRIEALPDGARPGGFSAGPQVRDKGGNGEPVESARLFVPGLMVRDAAAPGAPRDSSMLLAARSRPTSPEALAAAAKLRAIPPVSAAAALPLKGSPDPRWKDRDVYALAIQMPNVTSFTGSWLLWFSPRQRGMNVVPPAPVRKVDPKYVASAFDERIEGNVRLSAVIRGDGRVESVSVLKHLDDRLDRSAAEAIQKWEFQPAMRDGRAVEVDAVIEIPFRRAPRVEARR